MRTFIHVIFVLACFVLKPLYSNSVSQKIDELIKRMPHATIGILAKDLVTGEVILSRNSDKLLYPASGIKLFTAAAAFYQLSPDFRYTTTLSKKDNTIHITFTGSPSLTTKDLAKLFVKLKERGIRSIKGNIVLDISQVSAPYYAGGVSYDDLGWYYTPPDNALILNENAVPYDFISDKKLGRTIKIQSKSTDSPLTIINEVITVGQEQEREHCNFNIEIKPKNTLRLYGCLVQTEQPKRMKLAVPDPLLWAKEQIRTALKVNNIQFKGQIITGKTPKDASVVVTLCSKRLNQLLGLMLKDSDNLYANSFTKKLGYLLTGEGTYKQGVFAIKEILSKKTRLNFSQIKLSDGMGTRYNLATPTQIVVLLTDIYNDNKLRQLLIGALPQSGVTGTLQGRLKKPALMHKVYAKTGSMQDISSLSGYIIPEHENPIVFSIIINGINVPLYEAKLLEEAILLAIESRN